MLFKFYEKHIFRKLRLQSYRNTKKSEQKMLNNFKRIFGDEKNVVVCFGDYEQKKQMKFKEATKGKGMRTLFRKAGFQTYLANEKWNGTLDTKLNLHWYKTAPLIIFYIFLKII